MRVLFVHGLREFSLAYWTIRQAAMTRCREAVEFHAHAFSLDDVDNQEAYRIALAGW